MVRGPGVEASVLAALLALTMTAPVVLARRWPLLAAAVVAVAAVVNGLLFADLVRCSGAFPAALYIAFAVGARTRETGRGWGWTVIGLVITVGGLLAQWRGDAALNVDASFLPFGIGLAVACWAAGIGWSSIASRVRRSAGRARSARDRARGGRRRCWRRPPSAADNAPQATARRGEGMAVQVGPARSAARPTRAARQLPAAPGWLRRIGIGNLLATVVFTVGAFALVAEQQPTRGGDWAYVIVVLAVLPLLAMRRHPVAAPVTVAAMTLVAQLTVGPIVTCGVVLPTIFVMTFQLGSRLVTTIQLTLGGLGVIATVLIELLLDPALGTVDAAIFVFGLATAFFIGGLLIRSRVTDDGGAP